MTKGSVVDIVHITAKKRQEKPVHWISRNSFGNTITVKRRKQAVFGKVEKSVRTAPVFLSFLSEIFSERVDKKAECVIMSANPLKRGGGAKMPQGSLEI